MCSNFDNLSKLLVVFNFCSVITRSKSKQKQITKHTCEKIPRKNLKIKIHYKVKEIRFRLKIILILKKFPTSLKVHEKNEFESRPNIKCFGV